MSGLCNYLPGPATTGEIEMMRSEWGKKRGRVLALLENGEFGDRTAEQIAIESGTSVSFVNIVRRQERDRIQAEQGLPTSGAIPDDTPLTKVRYMLPRRAWNAIIAYGWVFKEDAPLRALKDTPDDMLLAMPQVGELAVQTIRQKFGYGPEYPTTARRLFA
jgi:hypothetical protein